jgi:hypothetical protein
MLDQVRFSNFDAVITRRPGQRNDDASLEALRSSLFGLHESALLAEPESQTKEDQRRPLDEHAIAPGADNLELERESQTMADQRSPPDEAEIAPNAEDLEHEPESQTMADQRGLPDEDEIDFDDADNLEPVPRFLADPDWPAPAQKVNFRPGFIMQATAFMMSFAYVAAGATLLRQSSMVAKGSVAPMRPVSSAEWVRSLPVDEAGSTNLVVKRIPGQ